MTDAAALLRTLVEMNRERDEALAKLDTYCACHWLAGEFRQCILHASAERALVEARARVEELEAETRSLDRICFLAADEDSWFGHEGDIKTQRIAAARHRSRMEGENK